MNLRRPHICAFVTGTALVLLAVVVVLRTDRVSHADPTRDSARLSLAVAHLNNACLTCHSEVSTGLDQTLPAPLYVADVRMADVRIADVGAADIGAADPYARPAVEWLASSGPLATVNSGERASWVRAPAITPDAQLLELGWRLLSLPQSELTRAADVIDVYVALAESPIPAVWTSDAQAGSYMDRLAGLEAGVRDLEHRAAPVQWSDAPTCPHEHRAFAAAYVAPHVPPNTPLLERAVVLAQPVTHTWTTIETPHLGLPYEIIFGTQRRGPPGGEPASAFAAGDHAVLPMLDTRECLPSGGSLSFFVWRATLHQDAGLLRFLPYPDVQRGYYVT